MKKIAGEATDSFVPARIVHSAISSAANNLIADEQFSSVDYLALVKRYLALGLILAAVGSIAGLAIVIFETPLYKAKVVLEVQPVSETVLSQGMDPFATVNNMDSVNIETEIALFQSGPSAGRILKKMRGVPSRLPHDKNGVFGRLRMLIRPRGATEEVSTARALRVAADSLTAKVINGTRLIELSCESSQPAIASDFLNGVADDFVHEAVRSRLESSEKTHTWLSTHLEQTKRQLQEADVQSRAFALKSGNVFAGNGATVDDVKLKMFQSELGAAESDRLAKQSRYETAVKEDIEAVPEVVQDPIAVTIRSQLAELERQRAILLVTLTANNPKVLAIEEQQRERKEALVHVAKNVIGRLQNDYRNAQRREDLLLSAYSAEGSQVNAQASKAEEFATLRREVDRLQKNYDLLLQEMNRTEVSQSAPVVPVRLVEPGSPPETPYKPKPSSMLMLGLMGGLSATFAIAFVREKNDRRLRSPESVQAMVRVQQLGVIPALEPQRAAGLGNWMPQMRRISAAKNTEKPVVDRGSEKVHSRGLAENAWSSSNQGSPVADSFRATIVSLTRRLGGLRHSKVILVSSSIPGEGKTTVALNLGIALAETGRRVTLIDADFRRPSLSRGLKVLGGHITVSNILQGNLPIAEYSIEELALETKHRDLYILPTTSSTADPTKLVHCPRLAELIERMKAEFDLVIVDAPPLLYLADARVISQLVDGVVLVVRSGMTEKESVRAAVKCLEDDGIPLLGTVLNDWSPTGSYNSRYYGYYYGAKHSQRLRGKDS